MMLPPVCRIISGWLDCDHSDIHTRAFENRLKGPTDAARVKQVRWDKDAPRFALLDPCPKGDRLVKGAGDVPSNECDSRFRHALFQQDSAHDFAFGWDYPNFHGWRRLGLGDQN